MDSDFAPAPRPPLAHFTGWGFLHYSKQGATCSRYNRKYSFCSSSDKERKLTGAELVNECMKKIIARGDSSSVSLMTEIRKAMEGDKVNLEGNVKAEMQTTEERLKIFDEIIGGK